jgi:hypothetical protein
MNERGALPVGGRPISVGYRCGFAALTIVPAIIGWRNRAPPGALI